MEKSNLRCCQSFLNSFRDFSDRRNQITQVPPEIFNFGWISRWVKRGTGPNGHEKMKFFQCRNQWYQSIGHHKRTKNIKILMLKLHPFPIYQALALHLYLLLYPASSHFNSSSTCGIKLKLTSALAPDKRSPLITSGTLSRDPRKFARRECNFTNVNKIWKMTTSVNFFYREDLLVKVLCECNL